MLLHICLSVPSFPILICGHKINHNLSNYNKFSLLISASGTAPVISCPSIVSCPIPTHAMSIGIFQVFSAIFGLDLDTRVWVYLASCSHFLFHGRGIFGLTLFGLVVFVVVVVLIVYGAGDWEGRKGSAYRKKSFGNAARPKRVPKKWVHSLLDGFANDFSMATA